MKNEINKILEESKKEFLVEWGEGFYKDRISAQQVWDIIEKFLTSLLQSQIKRLEERKRTDDTQMNEDHIYDDCLQETIDENNELIKQINK